MIRLWMNAARKLANIQSEMDSVLYWLENGIRIRDINSKNSLEDL